MERWDFTHSEEVEHSRSADKSTRWGLVGRQGLGFSERGWVAAAPIDRLCSWHRVGLFFFVSFFFSRALLVVLFGAF